MPICSLELCIPRNAEGGREMLPATQRPWCTSGRAMGPTPYILQREPCCLLLDRCIASSFKNHPLLQNEVWSTHSTVGTALVTLWALCLFSRSSGGCPFYPAPNQLPRARGPQVNGWLSSCLPPTPALNSRHTGSSDTQPPQGSRPGSSLTAGSSPTCLQGFATIPSSQQDLR